MNTVSVTVGSLTFSGDPAAIIRELWESLQTVTEENRKLRLVAAAAGRRVEVRVCKGCGKSTEFVTGDGRHGKRLFCNDSCKSREYQRRKKAGAA